MTSPPTPNFLTHYMSLITTNLRQLPSISPPITKPIKTHFTLRSTITHPITLYALHITPTVTMPNPTQQQPPHVSQHIPVVDITATDNLTNESLQLMHQHNSHTSLPHQQVLQQVNPQIDMSTLLQAFTSTISTLRDTLTHQQQRTTSVTSPLDNNIRECTPELSGILCTNLYKIQCLCNFLLFAITVYHGFFIVSLDPHPSFSLWLRTHVGTWG